MTSWTLALAASLRILVMPFEDATETGPESWKGAAFAEAVASHLEAGGHEVVATAERNRRLEEKGLSPEDALTRATAIVLGQELQANRVVVGVYRVGSDRLEVTARVIDLERGTTVGVLEDYDSVDAFVPLANRIAKNVFRIELDYIPGAVEACAARRDGLPAEAVEASARARLSLDGAERQRLLEQALSHEPSYVEARLQLGNILLERERSGKRSRFWPPFSLRPRRIERPILCSVSRILRWTIRARQRRFFRIWSSWRSGQISSTTWAWRG